MIKNILFGVLALFALWIGLNVWTYTPIGETKVEVCVGEVTGKTLPNGLHLVNPICSYDNFNTQNRVANYPDLPIPTGDRFKSNANLLVRFAIKTEALPEIREEYGNEELFMAKTLDKSIQIIVKSEGRKLPDSKMLADDKSVSKLSFNARERLEEELGKYLTFESVELTDIDFDERIMDQIIATKKRIEKEEVEKSQLRIDETQAQKVVKQKEAEALAAVATGNATRAKADAMLYEKQKEAEGIAAVGKALSANPQIIDFMKAEATKIRAERFDGNEVLTHKIYAAPITRVD